MANDAPEMFIGYRNLGLYYYNKGEMSKAERYIDIACSKPDIPPSFLTGAASIFLEVNKLDKAEELLLKSLMREPSNPETYWLLKMIYDKKGNRELADAYIVKARESIPGLDKELVKMAEDFCYEGEKFIAERKYNNSKNILWRALLVKPDYVPALVAMGRLGYEQGNFEDATRYLEKAITLDPSNASAKSTLFLINRKQGK
jgi:tetratricopeptide (TPR) repeat protein